MLLLYSSEFNCLVSSNVLYFHTVVKDLATPLFPHPSSEAMLRAIGPKTVHAERTLHFLSPREYAAMKAADKATRKQLSQQYGISRGQRKGRRPPVNSAIVIDTLHFEQKR